MRPPADHDIYMSFRFAILIKDQTVGASNVYTDPFTGSLWIGRAHRASEPPLGKVMEDMTECEVWMFPRSVVYEPENARNTARKIKVSWKKMRWIPFDLDATASEPAMEYVCLMDTTYEAVEKVEAADFPLSITQAFARPKFGT